MAKLRKLTHARLPIDFRKCDPARITSLPKSYNFMNKTNNLILLFLLPTNLS